VLIRAQEPVLDIGHAEPGKGKIMDPRFFRQYLNILDEQDTASLDVGNAKFTADKSTKTLAGQYDVDDKTQLSVNRDFNPGGATTVGVKTNVNGVDLTAQQNSPAYNKGQLAGTSSVSAAYKDTTGALGTPGQTHNIRIDKGVGFGGAGKNVRPGQNTVTTYTKT